MKIIDLLNKIANGEIKHNTKFRIYFSDKLHRDFYYDDSEENQLECLKNCSDNYSLYDDIRLNDEVEILEEEKKIPEKIEEKEIEISMAIGEQICANKINEIIDYLKNKGE